MPLQQEEIEGAISQAQRTWDALLKRNQSTKGDWTDDDNDTEHPQMLCEAMESFFIPALAHPDLANRLRKMGWSLPVLTLGRAMTALEKNGGFYPDDSYIIGKWPDGKPEQLVEVAAFLSTAILHFKYVFASDTTVERAFIERADKWLAKSLEFMHETHIPGAGWTWGSGRARRLTFLYFTYTVLEALEDVLDDRLIGFIPKSALPVAEKLRQDAAEAGQYLISTHVEGADPGMNIRDKIDFGEDASWYYNLWAIMGLSVAGAQGLPVDQDKVGLAIDLFRKRLADPGLRLTAPNKALGAKMEFPLEFEDGRYDVPSYSDRCGVPLALKVLIVAENNEYFGESTAEDFETSRKALWKSVFAERTLDGEPDLWERSGFSIYYTERVMEVCARLLGSDVVERVAEAERALEFTTSVPVATLAASLGVTALRARVDTVGNELDVLRAEVAALRKVVETVQRTSASDVPKPAGTALLEDSRLAVEKALSTPKAKKLTETERADYQARLDQIVSSDGDVDERMRALRLLKTDITEYSNTVGGKS